MYAEEAGLGIEISSGERIGGMLFADDFVSTAVLQPSSENTYNTTQDIIV